MIYEIHYIQLIVQSRIIFEHHKFLNRTVVIPENLTQIQARDLQNKSIQGVNCYTNLIRCISDHKIKHANNTVHACVYRHTYTNIYRHTQ